MVPNKSQLQTHSSDKNYFKPHSNNRYFRNTKNQVVKMDPTNVLSKFLFMISITFSFDVLLTSTVSLNRGVKSTFKNRLGAKKTSAIINGTPSLTDRLFYVQITLYSLSRKFFCGGTLIERDWVLTSAHCVHHVQANKILATVGDCSELGCTPRAKRIHKVEKIFIAPGYRTVVDSMGMKHHNNIALLKLSMPASKMIAEPLPICRENVPLGEILGFSGMGSTSKKFEALPTALRDTYFYESVFLSPTTSSLETCPEENICTDSLMLDSSICSMDQGGPLFKLKCESKTAECLYGVASYFESWFEPEQIEIEACNGGSVFTNVVKHYKWIAHTVSNS